MSLIESVIPWLSWALIGLSLPTIVWLTILGLVGSLPRRKQPPQPDVFTRLAVVVPAHNEALLIGGTVRALLQQDYPAESYAVWIVADHCSDDTAAIALAEGGQVLERNKHPGKGQALEEAFSYLGARGWEAFLVIDADSRLSAEALRAINARLVAGEQAIQLLYGVLNPADSLRTMAMEVALASFNGLRPLARARLGLSAGIMGNGFCLTKAALQKVPYQAHSIVEDLEYHLQLLDSGMKVSFEDRARVVAEMPVDSMAAKTQRVRWERGRFQILKARMVSLMTHLGRGRLAALEALVDLLVPPVGYLMFFLTPPLVLGPASARIVAASCIFCLVFHYGVACIRYGHLGRTIRVAGYLPYYLCWKVWVVFSSIFKEKNLGWQRTARKGETEMAPDGRGE